MAYEYEGVLERKACRCVWPRVLSCEQRSAATGKMSSAQFRHRIGRSQCRNRISRGGRLKALILLLLLGGCSMMDIRADYYRDNRGDCYAVSHDQITFDVKCPPDRFLGIMEAGTGATVRR